ncbi:MAG: PilT/PilU family type 4a pilus ATPase [Acidobacteria bacterium]|nr:PilT/PilU family type 4a pilus ATPase [Acidobacteriota bacterium]
MPLIPEQARSLLPTQPEVGFNYECSGVGSFAVKIRRLPTGVFVSFTPQVNSNTSAPTVAAAVRPTAPPPRPAAPASTSPPGNSAAPAAPTIAAPPPAANYATTPSRRPLAFTIDELFRAQVAMGASDLHLSVSMPPMVRKDGIMKVLDESHAPLDAEATTQLLMPIIPQTNRDEFSQRNGLVLVTGPTGSGKSTTLCAMVDYINRQRQDHIITIEDPIEFVHENKKCLINQREVHNHTDSFKDALRAALREDPDIVLVGEMRDLETVAIAIETAETGHLVFGTLHTTTAPSTVDRIIDQFPPDRQTQIRIMLSESLKGVISQTLLRKIGGGRVAALEVLIANSAMSNLIREGKTFQIPSMMQTGRGNGNVLLNESLIELVKSKTVAPDEAYAKAALHPLSLVKTLSSRD